MPFVDARQSLDFMLQKASATPTPPINCLDGQTSASLIIFLTKSKNEKKNTLLFKRKMIFSSVENTKENKTPPSCFIHALKKNYQFPI